MYKCLLGNLKQQSNVLSINDLSKLSSNNFTIVIVNFKTLSLLTTVYTDDVFKTLRLSAIVYYFE